MFLNIFTNTADKKAAYGFFKDIYFNKADFERDLEHFHNILGFILKN